MPPRNQTLDREKCAEIQAEVKAWADEDDITGLRVLGKVMRRARREVTVQNVIKIVVTYWVFGGGDMYTVEEWEPKTYLDIGSKVNLAVRVSTFTTKNGGAQTRLVMGGGFGAF